MTNAPAGECNFIRLSGSSSRSGRPAHPHAAFTLIEMLVVIAIMGILAALIFPVTAAVNKQKILGVAKTELAKVESAIEAYKAKTGSYPPDNTLAAANGTLYYPPYVNQLYYELVGTTFDPIAAKFTSKDGISTIPAANVKPLFGVDGFINASQGAGGDEGPKTDNFFKTIKPTQIGTLVDGTTKILVCSITWPNPGSPPYYPAGVANLNPWRYVSSSPTNNTRGFDLWVDVIVGGKTNRICNWSRDPIKVSTP